MIYKALILLTEKGVSPIKIRMIINSISEDNDFFNDYINSYSFEQLIGKEKAAEIRKDALILTENIMNICHDKNIGIITIFDESFPLYLKETESAPVLLYYMGDIKNLSLQKTAVAGTRRCSAYGRRVAEDIAAALADNGSAVIGSGTEGIEYIAMNMANKHDGCVIICCPFGLDNIPLSINHTYGKIEKLLLLSSRPLHSAVLKYSIIENIMLIALICDNGVIVEGGENSGALNLCDYLNEYGKDVYAVPGEIYSFASKGTNKLIADGRCSVLTSVSDIAEIKNNKIELRYNCNEKEFSDDEKEILTLLNEKNMTINEMADRTNKSIAELGATLVCMEMLSYIVRLPSNEYKISDECSPMFLNITDNRG